MSGRMNSGINIWEGVNPPISIVNNIESYGDISYFDMTEDGSIDLEDLAFLLGELGNLGGKSDLNKDGAVGLDDLAIILHMFTALD